MNMIIGLGGKAHHGKSTVAKIIKELYPSFENLAFAKSLKNMIIEIHHNAPELFMLTNDDINSIYTSNKTERMRTVLQLFATDVIRDMVSPTFWIDKVKNYIINNNIDATIEDMRFKNELELLNNLGNDFKTLSIYIKRELNNNELSVYNTKQSEHSSESELTEDDFDIVLNVSNDLNKTKEMIIDILGGFNYES